MSMESHYVLVATFTPGFFLFVLLRVSQSTKARKVSLSSCPETIKVKNTEENAVVRCPIHLRGHQPSGLPYSVQWKRLHLD